MDEREEWARGRVISFLCLLLIYSDAPRLSASGANKFLEPPRRLDTPSPVRVFPASPRRRAHLLTLFPRSDEIFRPHWTARRRHADRCNGTEKKQPVNVTRDRTRGFCVLDQIVTITVRTLRSEEFHFNHNTTTDHFNLHKLIARRDAWIINFCLVQCCYEKNYLDSKKPKLIFIILNWASQKRKIKSKIKRERESGLNRYIFG